MDKSEKVKAGKPKIPREARALAWAGECGGQNLPPWGMARKQLRQQARGLLITIRVTLLTLLIYSVPGSVEFLLPDLISFSSLSYTLRK